MTETADLYDRFKIRVKSQALYTKYVALGLKNRRSAEYIFGIETSEDSLYKDVISKIELSAQEQVEWLFLELCKVYNLPFETMGGNSNRSNDCDIMLMKDEKIIEVNFKSVLRPRDLAIKRTSYKTGRRPGRRPIRESDSYLVYLLKRSEEGYAWLEEHTEDDDSIKVVLVSDFIAEIFGKEEAHRFDVAMASFSNEMRETLGYRITQIGNEKALNELRKTLQEELPEFSYDRVRQLNDGAVDKEMRIIDTTFTQIQQRFLMNYKVLLGNNDFAISLLTSEWLYRQYGAVVGLDNTFVVAGYFKSIEQLLWDIISIVGKGREIGRKHSLIGSPDAKDSDTTLGPLKYFLNAGENQDLFNKVFGDEVARVRRYLNHQLSEWISHERNGKLHKNNLTADRVSEIREQTYFLYFLILGSLTLTKDTIALLIG